MKFILQFFLKIYLMGWLLDLLKIKLTEWDAINTVHECFNFLKWKLNFSVNQERLNVCIEEKKENLNQNSNYGCWPFLTRVFNVYEQLLNFYFPLIIHNNNSAYKYTLNNKYCSNSTKTCIDCKNSWPKKKKKMLTN